MPNYEDGKLYIIRNTITDDAYVGSTTQLLCNRMKNHRNDHNNQNKKHYNYRIYQCFREHGVEQFYIELLEKWSCSSKEELLAREGHWIRQLRPSLNSVIAGRTSQVYYQDHKETICQRVQEYAKQNRDAVLENKRQYYKTVRTTS